MSEEGESQNWPRSPMSEEGESQNWPLSPMSEEGESQNWPPSPMSEEGESQNLATITYAWGRRKSKFGHDHLCLRKENLSFITNFILKYMHSQSMDFQCHLSWYVLFSVIWGERWLFVLLILVKLLTSCLNFVFILKKKCFIKCSRKNCLFLNLHYMCS